MRSAPACQAGALLTGGEKERVMSSNRENMIRTIPTQVLHRAMAGGLCSPKLSNAVRSDIGYTEVVEQFESAINRGGVLFYRDDADSDRYPLTQEALDVGECSLVAAWSLRNDIL